MGEKQDKIWLAVAGIVVNSAGEWLVVKKNMGGLKDNGRCLLDLSNQVKRWMKLLYEK